MRTGRPVTAVNQGVDGQKFFAEFVESLFPISYKAARCLGEHLAIPRAASRVSVLDIGAGSGVWGIALAHQSPHVRVHAVDWPAVLEVTRRVALRHGVAERLTTSPGDLLEADFGKGHQMAVLGHILHSEGAERSRELLRRVFDALAPGCGGHQRVHAQRRPKRADERAAVCRQHAREHRKRGRLHVW